jgi:uncharacterized RDD family membrane protein YckC
MTCPRCGEDCRCAPEGAALERRWVPDSEDSAGNSTVVDALGAEPAAFSDLQPSVESTDCAESAEPVNENPAEADASAWRDELSAKLHRYRARRKPQPPRYPSLRLRFENNERVEDRSDEIRSLSSEAPGTPVFGTISNHALALEGLNEVTAIPVEDYADPGGQQAVEDQETGPQFSGHDNAAARGVPPPQTGAKIIEFPRFYDPTPPPASGNELAEPVLDRPRILEVPEIAPPPPALGGIMIEPAQKEVIQKRPGIDFPLQNASLARRVFAGAVDLAIVAAASAIFGVIFWKMTGFQPPLVQILISGAVIVCGLWAAYQYLLLVYSASTPGLRASGLELARFDGSRASRRVRRWRVLASYLSAASLGMGYVWVFLDDSTLCWHDRITRTHFAPKKRDDAKSLAA